MASANFRFVMQTAYIPSARILAYVNVLIETPRTIIRQTELLRTGIYKIIYINSPGNNTYKYSSYPNSVLKEDRFSIFPLQIYLAGL
jgi:hypothetical protein